MFLHFHKSDKSLNMSALSEYGLHGVKIRKLPVGKYVQVMRTLEGMPGLLAGEAFPDIGSMNELIAAFTGATMETAAAMAVRLLTVVPEQACRLIAGLLDIPEQRLLDPDEGLSPAELVQIIEAFWKINDMSNFFATVRRLTAQVGRTKADGGFSVGLP